VFTRRTQQDAYAFLRAILSDAQATGRLRPELGDLDLLTQTVWAALHGVIALEIAKCNADWVDFRPAVERVRLMIEFIRRGLEAEHERRPAGEH
jgi:hypothetical protein